MHIEDITDNIKKALDGKGFTIIAGVVVVMLIYVATSSNSSDNSSGEEKRLFFGSYPDAVTNANTIIDSVNKTTKENAKSILEETDKINNNLNSNYKSLIEKMDSFYNGLSTDAKNYYNALAKDNSSLASSIASLGAQNSNYFNTIVSEVTGTNNHIKDMEEKIDRIDTNSGGGSSTTNKDGSKDFQKKKLEEIVKKLGGKK